MKLIEIPYSVKFDEKELIVFLNKYLLPTRRIKSLRRLIETKKY